MKYFDKNTWFWIIITAIFFLPFLGGVHLFDWDEINFAELAREMYLTGDYLQMQINFERFTEKPPLFFWLQALSMELWGVGEYAARFPNAILGIIVVPFLYIAVKFLLNQRLGYLWDLSWFGSILPHLYFKSGIIDPLFNFLIFNGIFFIIHYLWKKKNEKEVYFSKSSMTYLWLAGISIGLAILTKGPVAYLLIFLTLVSYSALSRFKAGLKFKQLVKFSFIALLVFLLWFAVDLAFNGPDFLIEFTIRQWELLTTGDAGHKGFLGYHFVVLILGCFPASIFAIASLKKQDIIPPHIQNFKRWMVILLCVILVLFSLVGTKIIHYSSMAYYPISFLSALSLWTYLRYDIKPSKRVNIGLIIVGSLILMVSIALPYLGLHPDLLAELVKNDAFASENIRANVNWSYWDYIPAVIILIALVSYFVLLTKKTTKAFKALFFGTAIWVFAALISFIAKVESYSQRASVDFFQSYSQKDVYVATYGYKSYVPWFYAEVQDHGNENAADNNYLLYQATDKDVIISVKTDKRKELEANIKDAEFLYQKNGFYFYLRPAFNK